jgi:hypothetical protein
MVATSTVLNRPAADALGRSMLARSLTKRPRASTGMRNVALALAADSAALTTSTLRGATRRASAATSGSASNANTLGTSRPSRFEYSPIDDPTSTASRPRGTTWRSTRISFSPFQYR